MSFNLKLALICFMFNMVRLICCTLMYSGFLCTAKLSHYYAIQILCSVINRHIPTHYSRKNAGHKEETNKDESVFSVAVRAMQNTVKSLYAMIKQ